MKSAALEQKAMAPIDAAVELQALGNDAPVVLTGKLLLDHNGEPAELELNLAGLGEDQIKKAAEGDADDFLGKRAVVVRLVDGQEISTRIEVVRNTYFDSQGAIIARCQVGRAESATPAACVQGTWVLRLTNLKLRIGDMKSETPAPPGVPEHLRGWKLDKIVLTISGREWTLRDEMFGQWKNQSDREVHVALETATLTTSIAAGDTPDSVCEVGDAIAALLTFALARSVRVTKVEQVDVEGKTAWWVVRNVFAYPFSRRGFPAIDNWNFGTIRGFVERAYPIVSSDRKWWLATLDMFMQVHVNPYIETKSMLLNILADRIAAKLGVSADGAEIDAALGARMESEEFGRALHALFAKESANWTEERTRNLISTVKMWNARPSFAEGIRRACKVVRLKPPTTKLLGTRHRLMHVGELHPPDMTLSDYWKELEALVLLLIARMLDHEDYVYAAKFGSSQIRLSDYLEPSTPESPPTSEKA